MRSRLPDVAMCVALATAVSILAGCRGRGLFAPKGPLNQQQARAVIHDPFPQDDIGPKELAGRPPGYQRPLPLPERNRIVADNMPWLGR